MSALAPITALNVILPPTGMNNMIEIKKPEGCGLRSRRFWAV